MKIVITTLYLVFVYHVAIFSLPVSDAVLWGHKTVALFDLWTLQHIATGAIIAHVLTRTNYASQSTLWTIIMLSLFWESLELILELGHLQGLREIGIWTGGVEFWVNRVFIDPLAMIFGAAMYKYNKKIFSYSFIFTIVWLLNALYKHLAGVS